jgi:hypothetical protein
MHQLTWFYARTVPILRNQLQELVNLVGDKYLSGDPQLWAHSGQDRAPEAVKRSFRSSFVGFGHANQDCVGKGCGDVVLSNFLDSYFSEQSAYLLNAALSDFLGQVDGVDSQPRS